MVSAHPNTIEPASLRQPKLGDFFTPYQQSNQIMSPLIENGFDTTFSHQQMRNEMMLRQNSRSPLMNTTNTQFSKPQPLLSQENSKTVAAKNPKLYKTELCRSWMDHGRCNYGERCQYAHGEQEKRSIQRHPKYKTEACQSYHKTGYCAYGPRCHFIHNEEPHVLAQMIAQNAAAAAATANGNQQTQRPRNLGLQQTMSAPASTVATPMQRGPSTPIGSGIMPIGSKPNGTKSLRNSETDSSAPSATDSGSESPLGSFSPGLEYESDLLCNLSPNTFHRSISTSNTSSKWSSPCTPNNPFVGIEFWQPQQDSLVTAFSGLNVNYDGNDEKSIWEVPTTPPKTNSPIRLPVFERLSNNL